MPNTPKLAQANANRTPIGRSVSCRAVSLPAIVTVGPNGMTEKARKAGTAEMSGART